MAIGGAPETKSSWETDGHDPVIACRATANPLTIRDRGARWRIVGLVAVPLITFFAVAWFLHFMVGEAFVGAPGSLGVIGLQPPASPPQARSLQAQADPRAVDHRAPTIEKAPRAGVTGPAGTVRIELLHQLPAGRLIVMVDGKTGLSKPFTEKDEVQGKVSHHLSVPAGRHDIRVRLLGERSELRAESSISRKLDPGQIALLRVQQVHAAPAGLTLEWIPGTESGTRTSDRSE